ncbi:hypothetical protein [Streptomyces sp. NPDC014894]
MDQLIAVADGDLAAALVGREELSHARARTLAARAANGLFGSEYTS